MDISQIIKEPHEQLYAHTLDNLEKTISLKDANYQNQHKEKQIIWIELYLLKKLNW